MKPTNDINIPSWVYSLVGFIMVVTVVVAILFNLQVWTWGQEKLVVHLQPNEWSEQVTTPPGTSYSIDAEVDTEIDFQDGGPPVYIGPSYKDRDHGMRRGIFWLRSCDEGTVTITITR